MRIRCHQVVKAHSTKDGFDAPEIVSKRNGINSFGVKFKTDRRNIPCTDLNRYVLEIEPINDSFECCAAICTQIKNDGDPTSYTGWLIPEDRKIENTLKILSKENFAGGQEVTDAYEKGKSLPMREVEVDNQRFIPEWAMTEKQEKTMGQFLALYWMCMSQNVPSEGRTVNRIYLVLRDTQSKEILKDERAVEFFRKEIVSRLPREAYCMLSAVFGAKNNEDGIFKNAVCVVFQSESDIKSSSKVIDLVNRDRDILPLFLLNHDDREGLNTIAECLLGGEQSYPDLYKQLRGLRNGIPVEKAPHIMLLCKVLSEFEKKQDSQRMEKCYAAILKTLVDGGISENEAKEKLRPVIMRIAEKWLTHQNPDAAFFQKKSEWARERVGLTPEESVKLLEPLAKKVIDELRNSVKIANTSKFEQLSGLLGNYGSEYEIPSSLLEPIERFLSSCFEEWLFWYTDSDNDNISLPNLSFEKIIKTWNVSKLMNPPDEVIRRLTSFLEKHQGLSDEIVKNTLAELDKKSLANIINGFGDNAQQSGEHSVEEISNLASQIAKVEKADSSSVELKTATNVLKKNFLVWALNEPPVIKGCNHILEVIKGWLNHDIENADGCGGEEISKLEDNIQKALTDYAVSKDEQAQLLAPLHRKAARYKLEGILNDTFLSETDKALRIAELHSKYRKIANVFQEGDDLDEHFCEAMNPLFLDWEKASNPFASTSAFGYDDDWLITVSDKWLHEILEEKLPDLTIERLQELDKDLCNAYGKYKKPHDQQNKYLAPLRLALCKAKLEDLQNRDINDRDAALQIAGVYNEFGKKVKKYGVDEQGTEEIEQTVRDMLQDRFVAWSKADKPFSSGVDGKYEDKSIFEKVVKNWLEYGLNNDDLDSGDMEEIETKIQTVFSKYYKVDSKAQNEMFAEFRRNWAISKIGQVLSDMTIDETQRAIEIAGIHNKLRKLPGVLEDGSDLCLELERAVEDLFIPWSRAAKPFASGNQMKYEDDWFRDVAFQWLQDERFVGAEYKDIEQLEKQLGTVLGYYKVMSNEQNRKLEALRLYMYRAELFEAKNDYDRNNPELANALVQIHDKLHKANLSDMQETDNLEAELKESLRECFVAWCYANKPFFCGHSIGGNNDFFTQIAEEWLKYDLPNTMLSVEELEKLESELKKAFISYRVPSSRQNELLADLRTKLGEAKLTDILDNGGMTESEKAVKIAGLHNTLRNMAGVLGEGENESELANSIQSAMLDLFIDWSYADKPFACDNGMNYDGKWFESLLSVWCDHYLNTIDMSLSEFKELMQKIENAAVRNYKLHNWDRMRKLIRNKYADLFLMESENKTEITETDIGMAADLLFGELDEQNETDLYDRFKNFLACNFVGWSELEPPFCVHSINSVGYYRSQYVRDTFLNILKLWNDRYFETSNIDNTNAGTLKEKIQKKCDSMGIDVNSSNDVMRKLDMICFHEKYDEIRNNEPTPQSMSELAGICKSLLSYDEADDNTTKLNNDIIKLKNDIIGTLKNNLYVWADQEYPLSVAGCGYREPFVIKIVEEWINNELQDATKNEDDLMKVRDQIKSASRQFNSYTGQGVSQEALEKLDDYVTKLYNERLKKNARQLISKMRNGNDSRDADMITRALNTYADLLNINTENIDDGDIINNLENILVQEFYIIITQEMKFPRDDIFLRLSEKWINMHLVNTWFNKIEEIRDLKVKLEKKYKAARADEKQNRQLEIAFEEAWLRKAIEMDPNDRDTGEWDNDTENNSVSFSDIAASDARIKSYGGCLSKEMSEKLDEFLLANFKHWSKSDFTSEYGRNSYTYDEFPILVTKWIDSGAPNRLSVRELERIERKISDALSGGYNYTPSQVDEKLQPLKKIMKKVLLSEVVTDPGEDNLRRLKQMYRENPIEHYRDVFPVYVELASKGAASDLIASFISEHEQLWDDIADPDYRKGIAAFMDNLCRVYGSSRPDELQETMEAILRKKRYKIPLSNENGIHWSELKDRMLKKVIDEFMKDHGDSSEIADIWLEHKSKTYDITWKELTGLPLFRNAVESRCNSFWNSADNDVQKIDMAIGLAEMICGLKTKGEDAYCRILFEKFLSYAKECYGFEPGRDVESKLIELNNRLKKLSEKGFDIKALTESESYRSWQYRKNFEHLLTAWDVRLVCDMLGQRPDIRGNALTGVEIPKKQYSNTDGFYLSLLFCLPKSNGDEYWADVFKALNILDFAEIDRTDLKKLAGTSFLDDLARCYKLLSDAGADWALSDLKHYIKRTAPKFWRELHQSSWFSSGIKKLVKDGWDGLPKDFASWLKAE